MHQPLCNLSSQNFNQQHPPSFFFSIDGSLCINTFPPAPFLFPLLLPPSLLLTLYISCTSSSNTSRTFMSVKALVSMNSRLFSCANSIARSVETLRSAGLYSHKSNLLPTSIITMSGSACSLTSSSHFFTELND